MTEISPRHRKKRLEKYIGKNVRVTFKDGHFCEGILTHHGWKYGMDDCVWYSKNGTYYDDIYHFSFCHSNVRKIDVLVM